MDKKVYITLTGTKYYYGKDFLAPQMKVVLRKDPENEYDSEAIKVELEGLGQIGSVANSVSTVIGQSMSAGRLYDKIGDTAAGIVAYNLVNGVVCELVQEEPEDAEPPKQD
jgi:hypothetical protein